MRRVNTAEYMLALVGADEVESCCWALYRDERALMACVGLACHVYSISA